MKKLVLPFLFLAAMTACSTPSIDKNADTQVPIYPLRYAGGVMHVYLTDYLPQLDTLSEVNLSIDSRYRITPTSPLEFDIEGDAGLSNKDAGLSNKDAGLSNKDAGLSNLHVTANGEVWDFPVIPVREAVPFIIPVSATDSSVTIGVQGVKGEVQWLAYVQNTLLPQEAIRLIPEEDSVAIIYLPKSQSGRTYLTVYAMASGVLANEVLVPLEDGKPVLSAELLTRHDDHAQVLYSLMIDRFANGNTKNDWKMRSPNVLDIVDYQGGDICGIEQKIKEGFFDDLGVTTIWISPITQNPWDEWGRYPFPIGNKYDSTKTFTRYSGYHGYWPIFATSLEKRFSTPKELHRMLSTAHAHDKNVILDYVANHMHIQSPTLQAHPDWHTDSLLPDGRRNFELWDEARLTTWFDVHIPTLDLEREDVCFPMTDSALYWLETYDFDGYRHDACKHIPECYWRMLTHKMKVRFPNRHIWMIGETYGSPELIGTYVKSGMLNAQFDFNVYWTTMHAICGDQPMADIDKVVRQSMSCYGAHHTMGCISGNHDQVRFASLAGGGIRFDEDGKREGWTREVELLPADLPAEAIPQATQEALRKAMLLQMVNFTIPGVPCIYQGDEYAEVGGNDPDNRHMMRFDLDEQQNAFREKVKQLIGLRRSHMALMYGQYLPIQTTDDTIEFERVYMGEKVHVVISRVQESSITINGERVFAI